MARLSISRAWDDTKTRIASDGRLMVIVAAALLLLPQALVALMAPPVELSGVQPGGLATLVMLIAGLVGIVGQVAIIHLAIVHGASVGEAISHGLKRLLPIIGAILLICLVIFLIAVPIVFFSAGTADLAAANSPERTRSVLLAAGVIAILALLLAPKIILLMPVATAERGGSIHMLKRSWTLSSGHYWRLLGFMLLVLVAAIFVGLATQFLIGSLLVIMLGAIEPMSVGALVYGLLFGAAQALFAVILTVMLARIYVQLAGADVETVTVPSSGT